MGAPSIGELNPLHASTIGRIEVGFVISAATLRPSEVTEAVRINADFSAGRGDERRDIRGNFLMPHDEGVWRLATSNRVFSKDVNEHLVFLLDQLLPHKEYLIEIKKRLNASFLFDVLWESSYLYAGSGPLLSSKVIKGIADLEADLAFDIYQIDLDQE